MTGASSLQQRAAELDDKDALAGLRDRFTLPAGVTYLDGNSLGALPAHVPGRLQEVVRREWGRGLIASWEEAGWWDAPQRVGERIALLVGAAPGQVVVGDSTSTGVFKLLVAGLRMVAPRDELLVDARTFPTDGYVAGSVARLTGAQVRPVDPDALPGALSDRTGLVLVNHVDYRTGALLDLDAVTQVVHAAGARVVWDLSHSVGVLPIGLDRAGVDLAVGATYKFLNGGPGAPAFVYVPTALQASLDQPLTGWGAHADPFGMHPGFVPADGVARLRTGTPEILSLLALEAALDVWDDVDLAAVRAKGLSLTGYFMDCVDELVAPQVARVVTPRGEDRGHQVSVAVPDSGEVVARMAAEGVVTDHRPPDLVRFGFAPLYVRHVDAWHAASTLARVLG